MIVTDLSNSFNPCPKTLVKDKEKKTTIKKKSNKLVQKEKKRFSILTKNLEKMLFMSKQEKRNTRNL